MAIGADEQLSKLADLRDWGVLSEEEFAAQKARIRDAHIDQIRGAIHQATALYILCGVAPSDISTDRERGNESEQRGVE
ncbi:MAG: SHOCT domain-containing protein, partial [Solirubrobacteraceae bacterium]